LSKRPKTGTKTKQNKAKEAKQSKKSNKATQDKKTKDNKRQVGIMQTNERQGNSTQGKARHCKAREHNKTRYDKTRKDKTRLDKTRQDKTRQNKTRQDFFRPSSLAHQRQDTAPHRDNTRQRQKTKDKKTKDKKAKYRTRRQEDKGQEPLVFSSSFLSLALPLSVLFCIVHLYCLIGHGILCLLGFDCSSFFVPWCPVLFNLSVAALSPCHTERPSESATTGHTTDQLKTL
jgi:hypothetical protein